MERNRTQNNQRMNEDDLALFLKAESIKDKLRTRAERAEAELQQLKQFVKLIASNRDSRDPVVEKAVEILYLMPKPNATRYDWHQWKKRRNAWIQATQDGIRATRALREA